LNKPLAPQKLKQKEEDKKRNEMVLAYSLVLFIRREEQKTPGRDLEKNPQKKTF